MFSIPHLNTLRRAEIDRIVAFFEPQARVLEIGAGTGEQALELKRRGFEVTAIEIADFKLCLEPPVSHHRLRRPAYPAARCQCRHRLFLERAGARS